MTNSNPQNHNFLVRFFWFCSGANIRVLEKAQADQGRYATIGFTILLISILASFSGGYGFWTIFKSEGMAVFFGGFWGLMIGNLDRFLVSSIRKKEKPSSGDQAKSVAFFTVRLALAGTIGFAIAKPVELRFFQEEIVAELGTYNREQITNEKDKINEKYKNDLNLLNNQLQKERDQLKKLEDAVDQADNAYKSEIAGKGRTRRPGVGQNSDNERATFNRKIQELVKKRPTLEKAISDKEIEIKNKETSKNEEIKTQENKFKNADGFAARVASLHRLGVKDKTYDYTSWLITAILVLFDTAPIIIKLLIPRGVYDSLLESFEEKQSTLKVTEIDQELIYEHDINMKSLDDEQELKLEENKVNQKLKLDFAEKITQAHLDAIKKMDIDSKDEYDKIIKEFTNNYVDFLRQNGSSHNNTKKKSPFSSDPDEGNFYPFPRWEAIPQNYVSFAFPNTRKISFSSSPLNPLSLQFQWLQKLWDKKPVRYCLIGLTGLLTVLGTLLTIWIAMESAVIARFKLKPLNFPGNMSPNLVYAENNQILLNPQRPKVHLELALESFSPYLPKAAIASEDKRFYHHNGFDFLGIARAGWETLHGNTQGASTLAQQLAGDLYLKKDKDYNNLPSHRKKMQKILLGIKLESIYDKKEILSAYLNRIYAGGENYQGLPSYKDLGSEIDGFEELAQFYFDKSAKDLDISEAATLVKMLPSPNDFNPVKNYELAKKKRDNGITQMKAQGLITGPEAEEALQSEIPVKPKNPKSDSGLMKPSIGYRKDVQFELNEVLGKQQAESQQFIVKTTINAEYQLTATKILQENIQTQGNEFNYSKGALVTMDYRNGEVLALVGITKEKIFIFQNQADYAPAPASTFKLFTYLTALQQGISPSQLISCDPLKRGNKVFNCHGVTGKISMTKGLALSANPIALRLADQVGFDKVASLAESIDIKIDPKFKSSKNDELILGVNETSLLQMAGAYAAIANKGIWNKPHMIRQILDRNKCDNVEQVDTCTIVYSANKNSNNSQFDNKNKRQFVAPEISQKMMKMLRSPVTGGTATRANISSQIVGKTGTSDYARDRWFIGIIPERNLLVGVWLGNECNSDACKKPEYSSAQAVSLWVTYVNSILQK